MRSFYVTTFVAFAAYVNADHGVHCNHDHPNQGISGALTNTLIDALGSHAVAELCTKELEQNPQEFLQVQAGEVTFQIMREHKDHSHTASDCKNAFKSIIYECVAVGNVWGGDIWGDDGVSYEIFHTEMQKRDFNNIGVYDQEYELDVDKREAGPGSSENTSEENTSAGIELEKRKGRPKTPKGPKIDPKPKESPRPRESSIPKESPKPKESSKPLPSRKSEASDEPGLSGKSKTSKSASPNSPRKTSSRASRTFDTFSTPSHMSRTASRDSRVSSRAPTTSPRDSATTLSPTPKSCRDIIKAVERDLRAETRGRIDTRDMDHVGSMSSLSKRTQKPGISCGEAFNALDYPDTAQMPPNALVYGWQNPDQCKRMEWGNGGSFTQQSTASYDVEHIMEWQLVTKFFDWLDEKHFAGQKFDDPNPQRMSGGGRAQVSFCQYWKAYASRTPAFPIGNSPARRLKDHIKWNFPSNQAFQNEFVWLERSINTPTKLHMWTKKSTSGIFSDTRLRNKIESKDPNRAREAAMQLKYLLGAQKYMKDATISRLLATQKNRIGAILNEIDTNLPNNRIGSGAQQWDAWQPKQLQTLWNTYMDEKFTTARSRTRYTMNKHLKSLYNGWVKNPPKGERQNNSPALQELRAHIRALITEWKKERRADWRNPASW